MNFFPLAASCESVEHDSTLWTRPWQGLCPLSLSLFTVFVHSTVTGPLPSATITSYREFWKSVRSHTLSSKNAAPHCSNSIHPIDKINKGIRMSALSFPEWSIVCSNRQFWTGSSNTLYSESWMRCGHWFETLSQGHLIACQEFPGYFFLLQLVTKSNHKMSLWYKLHIG